MDTLPLPPRPRVEQYRKRARALVSAAASPEPDAIQRWASEWLASLAGHLDIPLTPFVRGSVDRAVETIERKIRAQRERRHPGERFALADAQSFLAEAHGFASWAAFARHVETLSGADTTGSAFERAADAVVSGDLAALASLLRQNPDLIRARSNRVHRVTLLHYVAANGVEDFRQKTPPNAVAIARLLLDSGAEVDALAETYGGGAEQTTMNLLVSSVHPAAAGVQGSLVATLIGGGAAANGVRGDGSPLMTAIAFGYPDAARALADGGARIDNVIAAAALGRADLVRRFVVDRNTVAQGVPLVAPRWFELPNEPHDHIERALVSACKFGRVEVTELLLDLGVAPAASDDLTGLHWAAGHRYLGVVKLMIARGAPLEVRNAWGGTVLDSTVWFAMNPPTGHPHGTPDVGYIPILETLIDAGADVNEVEPFPTGLADIDQLLRRHGRAERST